MTDDTLGARLRQHRKDNGLTQGDVAALLGISVSYLSDIERSRRGVPAVMATMRRIEALIGAAPPPAAEVDWRAISIHLDTECAKLAAALYALSEDHAALKAELDELKAANDDDWECAGCGRTLRMEGCKKCEQEQRNAG